MQYILADSCNTSWQIIVFKLNGRIYRQKFGTAMGTKMAPSFANIFMSDLENRFLQTQRILPLIWRRYIDDIVMIWTHGRDSLETFLHELNTFHHSIKFTFDISNTEAAFLDVTVHKGERFKATQILDCRTHFKTTNTFQYVHGSSCHPPGVKKGIVIGECLRFLRNTSNKAEFEEQKISLLMHLQARGYPTEETQKRIHEKNESHQQHLEDAQTTKTEQANLCNYLQSVVDRP